MTGAGFVLDGRAERPARVLRALFARNRLESMTVQMFLTSFDQTATSTKLLYKDSMKKFVSAVIISLTSSVYVYTSKECHVDIFMI